ncbi:hypothetical protein [Streptomyces sp. NPDC048428]|uniref:hypothetical protein n=1 Tax=Streptomyces sp. NPDC048428 TaxID=3154503 RepID=UPI0034350667
MIAQGVMVRTQCEDCGGVLSLDLGQHMLNGQLWWGTVGECTACPNAWCWEDTGGTTPARIRDALLAEHGPAQLHLADDGSSRVPVMRALREVLQLSLSQARSMADTLQRTGLVGTLVEMEFIADGLQRRSVATTIEMPAA